MKIAILPFVFILFASVAVIGIIIGINRGIEKRENFTSKVKS
jgi:hypothetical protein